MGNLDVPVEQKCSPNCIKVKKWNVRRKLLGQKECSGGYQCSSCVSFSSLLLLLQYYLADRTKMKYFCCFAPLFIKEPTVRSGKGNPGVAAVSPDHIVQDVPPAQWGIPHPGKCSVVAGLFGARQPHPDIYLQLSGEYPTWGSVSMFLRLSGAYPTRRSVICIWVILACSYLSGRESSLFTRRFQASFYISFVPPSNDLSFWVGVHEVDYSPKNSESSSFSLLGGRMGFFQACLIKAPFLPGCISNVPSENNHDNRQ